MMQDILLHLRIDKSPARFSLFYLLPNLGGRNTEYRKIKHHRLSKFGQFLAAGIKCLQLSVGARRSTKDGIF